ncbi:Predicted phosphatase [Phaffia rhodozyma]|uniref:Predicted phosphatase n=1 Tax=Phaffia rhodozyma TaxID=264483 RepID=A0A0F7SII6_PHARH|nr:Predicted phosphatase [Phaffia rhodozyma]
MSLFLTSKALKLAPRPAMYRRFLTLEKGAVSFAFDIDGVLKYGEEVFPGAKRALKQLEAEKVPYVLLTNGGGVTDAKRCSLLSKDLGVTISPTQLIQSHTPLRETLAKRYADEAVLIVGGKNDLGRYVANSYGLNKAFLSIDVKRWQSSVWPMRELSQEDLKYTVEHDFSQTSFKAIIVINDSRDWGLDISVMSEILAARDGVLGTIKEKVTTANQTVEVIYCNPDLLWKNDYILPRYGAGAFKTAFVEIHQETFPEHQIQSVQYGKPHRPTYDFAKQMLERRVEELYPGHTRKGGLGTVYMVGDNPESDIRGANDYNWRSMLVQTGVYQTENGPPKYAPFRLERNVEDAVNWALKEHGLAGTSF